MSTVRPTLDTTFATLPEALELSLEDEPPRRHHRPPINVRIRRDRGFPEVSGARLKRALHLPAIRHLRGQGVAR